MRIYFDACCLHRPLDDQSQERIRLESEAITLFLLLHLKRKIVWVSREALEEEILQNPDEHKRSVVQSLLQLADVRVEIDEKVVVLAREVVDQGIGAMDALHLALAETGGLSASFDNRR